RLRCDPLMSRLARRGLSSNRLRNMRPGVLAELEQRRMELKRAVEPPSVRIGQQLRGIKTEPSLWIIGTLDAEAVARASVETGREAAQHTVSIARHRRAMNFAIAVVDTQRCVL